MTANQGAIAAGHIKTAEAAKIILQEGGNAFDAALAAMCASCVAEPVLASLGGGGFLLAHEDGASPLLYDFFVQSPLHRPPLSDTDFYPIVADFGTAQQEFHIGMGSIATPGMIRGLFAIHRDLCKLPLKTIVEPACEMAREGVTLNSFQHYIATVVAPIIEASPEARQLHENSHRPGTKASIGDKTTNQDFAGTLELLAIEGEEIFYQGEMGQQLSRDCREHGGCLDMQDLNHYRLERRTPTKLHYHDANIYTNPPPSIGGTLIAFALSLLEPEGLGNNPWGSEPHIRKLARAMWLTQQLRKQQEIDKDLDAATAARILGNPFLSAYRNTLKQHSPFSRGTTHISIIDRENNIASMTLSNGEGSSYVLPNTGIMLNNMLGEEDINPHGFHQWPENRRIASMMAPTILLTPNGQTAAIGSGGSNRIRSAIMQTLINLLDYDLTIEQAIEQARIHFESGLLNYETGIPDQTLSTLLDEFPKQKHWPEKNLFFGGAHSVIKDKEGRLHGAGDSRRGGVYLSA